MKTNIILGITGQDGSLMAKRLIEKGETDGTGAPSLR